MKDIVCFELYYWKKLKFFQEAAYPLPVNLLAKDFQSEKSTQGSTTSTV